MVRSIIVIPTSACPLTRPEGRRRLQAGRRRSVGSWRLFRRIVPSVGGGWRRHAVGGAVAGVGVASVSRVGAVGVIPVPVPAVPPASMVVVRVVVVPVPSVLPRRRAVPAVRPAVPLLPVRVVRMVRGLGRGVHVLLVVVGGAARCSIAPPGVPVPLSVSLAPVPLPVPFRHWRRLVQGARGGHVRVGGHVYPSGTGVLIWGVTGDWRRRGEPGPASVERCGVLRRNSVRLVVVARLEPGRGRHGRGRAGGRREHVLCGETTAVACMPEDKIGNTFRPHASSSRCSNRHADISNGTHLPPEYPESWEKGVPERDVYGVPPPCEEHEEPGVYGHPREDGGVSRCCSPNPVSAGHGVVLPSGGTGI